MEGRSIEVAFEGSGSYFDCEFFVLRLGAKGEKGGQIRICSGVSTQRVWYVSTEHSPNARNTSATASRSSRSDIQASVKLCKI